MQLIFPATEAHIAKYSSSEFYFLLETYEDWTQITAPFIRNKAFDLTVSQHFSIFFKNLRCRIWVLFEFVYLKSGSITSLSIRKKRNGLLMRIHVHPMASFSCLIWSGMVKRWRICICWELSIRSPLNPCVVWMALIYHFWRVFKKRLTKRSKTSTVLKGNIFSLLFKTKLLSN